MDKGKSLRLSISLLSVGLAVDFYFPQDLLLVVAKIACIKPYWIISLTDGSSSAFGSISIASVDFSTPT
jgi:hypothetical protein